MPTLVENLKPYVRPGSANKCWAAIYRCHCGTLFKAEKSHVNSGRTRSCGCARIKCHDQAHATRRANRKKRKTCGWCKKRKTSGGYDRIRWRLTYAPHVRRKMAWACCATCAEQLRQQALAKQATSPQQLPPADDPTSHPALEPKPKRKRVQRADAESSDPVGLTAP